MHQAELIADWDRLQTGHKALTHPIYQVLAVEVIEPYTLLVQFTDDTEQVINLQPVLAGELC